MTPGELLRIVLRRAPMRHSGCLLGSRDEARTVMEAIAWKLLEVDGECLVRTPAGDCVLRDLEGLRGSA